MQCPTGKEIIASYELAEKLRKRSRKNYSKPMSTYRFGVCGCLHLGEPSGMKKRIKTIRNNRNFGVDGSA